MTDPFSRLAEALADRYTLERELGQGGMATVYLSHDLRHDRKVALKVLRPELAAVIGAERFLHEIKTTANLQHPHILPLFDSGRVDGTVFYVMPFVEGESLRDRLTREKQLPIDDAVRITREVASALDYAHRHGVIHRDIKPENILLHDGQALVADFGIALAANSAGANRMTETGMSLGTPHYMSPEQAMGERAITPRSDVYALGCVAYEMLTGDPPFSGATAQAIVAQVITEDPKPPTLRRKTIPPAVEDAVLTALAKLPADRFGSAAEFAEALVEPDVEISDPRAVPCVDGSTTDLCRYPARRGFEDIAILCTDPGVEFGWSAVTFPEERFVWFALRNAQQLTSTLLWFSNGGRHYPPWNGRHINVLGVEDMTGFFHAGLAASCRPNLLSERGVRTCLQPDAKGRLSIPYIQGVAGVPAGFDRVATIESRSDDGSLVIHADSGAMVEVPCQTAFLRTGTLPDLEAS